MLSLFGYSKVEDVLGHNVSILMNNKDVKNNEEIKNYLFSIQGNKLGQGRTVEAKKNNGMLFHSRLNISSFEEKGEYLFVGVLSDITELIDYQAELESSAFYDSLTGLVRRHLLENRIELPISKSIRNRSKSALLFIDLDNFKPINDIYGHAIGDMVLMAIAERIQNEVREVDACARFGGDELVILLDNTKTTEGVESIKLKLQKKYLIRYSPINYI